MINDKLTLGGAVFDNKEGERIASLVGDKRIAILQNHGAISLGKLAIDEAAWWSVHPTTLIPIPSSSHLSIFQLSTHHYPTFRTLFDTSLTTHYGPLTTDQTPSPTNKSGKSISKCAATLNCSTMQLVENPIL